MRWFLPPLSSLSSSSLSLCFPYSILVAGLYHFRSFPPDTSIILLGRKRKLKKATTRIAPTTAKKRQTATTTTATRTTTVKTWKIVCHDFCCLLVFISPWPQNGCQVELSLSVLLLRRLHLSVKQLETNNDATVWHDRLLVWTGKDKICRFSMNLLSIRNRYYLSDGEASTMLMILLFPQIYLLITSPPTRS